MPGLAGRRSGFWHRRRSSRSGCSSFVGDHGGRGGRAFPGGSVDDFEVEDSGPSGLCWMRWRSRGRVGATSSATSSWRRLGPRPSGFGGGGGDGGAVTLAEGNQRWG